MPVHRLYQSADMIWGFWRIEEEESALRRAVPFETIPAEIQNPRKRLEFLASRTLIRALLHEWQLPYGGLTKDAFGKPFLSGSDTHLSLSHSFPYVAAVIHKHKNVGIDLEQPRQKLLRIASRVLAENELADAGDNIVKHCIYWCAKEALVKIHGRKDLIFSENLLISPFNLNEKGHLIGRIIANKTETAIPLEYVVYDNFVVAVSRN